VLFDGKIGLADLGQYQVERVLRALIMVLEKLSPEGILARELATGVPVIYRLNADSTVATKVDLAA